MTKLRFAAEEDSAALLKIYKQYIETSVTFEYELPSEGEFAARIRDISEMFPYIVCELDGRAVGYAYAHHPWERAAYQWNAELSIYLDEGVRAQGIGKMLYGALIEILMLQGVKTAYGVVALPNPASEGLHLGMGFWPEATFGKVGYKLGGWHDTRWFRKDLAPCEGEPRPIRPVGQLDGKQLDEILLRAAGRAGN